MTSRSHPTPRTTQTKATAMGPTRITRNMCRHLARRRINKNKNQFVRSIFLRGAPRARVSSRAVADQALTKMLAVVSVRFPRPATTSAGSSSRHRHRLQTASPPRTTTMMMTSTATSAALSSTSPSSSSCERTAATSPSRDRSSSSMRVKTSLLLSRLLLLVMK